MAQNWHIFNHKKDRLVMGGRFIGVDFYVGIF